MEDEARSFREFIVAEGLGKPGTQYPEEVRELAVELCGRMLEAGFAQKRIQALLGVQWITLAKWRRAAVKPAKSVIPRPVTVRRDSAGTATLTLRSPGGWAIEGLSFEQVRELVR